MYSQAGEGLFPAFDHAVGDPREAEIHIEAHHRIVLIEGNYLLLGERHSRHSCIQHITGCTPAFSCIILLYLGEHSASEISFMASIFASKLYS